MSPEYVLPGQPGSQPVLSGGRSVVPLRWMNRVRGVSCDPTPPGLFSLQVVADHTDNAADEPEVIDAAQSWCVKAGSTEIISRKG
ncbi:hypothetical protein GOB93_05035 [Acetobacter musti]|uniref:Uncharacterized protein n=1 Tax=Acetobacter musti TaxID=864732 RepID=A0ABX0JPQ7_9PROT|nr:hypothetical protein [Acetobacter musti]NHN84007.1 hypothetical protein [Acetobacter musti]